MKGKTRISFVGAMPPPPGGVSVHIERFVARLKTDPSFDLSVLNFRRRTVYRPGKGYSGLGGLIKCFLGAHLVHIHLSRDAKVLVALLSKLLGKKVIYTHHGSVPTASRALAFMVAICDRTILVNDANSMLNEVLRRKISVIPAFLPPMDPPQLELSLQEQISSFHAVICSNSFHPPELSLIEGKDCYGFDTLIKAFGLMMSKPAALPAILVLVDPTGHGRPLTADLLRDPGIPNGGKILYVDRSIDFAALIRASNLLARTSRSDGDSLAVREALHFGIPVVASDCTTRPEGTLLYGTENVEELAEKMEEALRSGLDRSYPQPDYGKQILDVYRDVTREGRPKLKDRHDNLSRVLYERLPCRLQDLACTIQGWRINRRRYGRGFWELLRAAEPRARWIEAEILEFRNERLRAFLEQALETTPLYRNLNLPSNFRSDHPEKWLEAFPILDKATVQRNTEAVESRGDFGSVVPVHTSGTTGTGLNFLATMQAVQEQWAVWWRFRRWHGIPFHEKCGYFGGRMIVPLKQRRPPFWRFNAAGKQILFSAHHMSDEYLGSYVDALNLMRPRWLHGYPSLIALVAGYCLQYHRKLDYPLSWITTSAENLLASQKELIKEAFGIAPIQHYGMAEGAANFSECPLGNLHVDEDFAMVEFVPAREPGQYHVIGTNFSNPAAPLIRYNVGDIVRLSGRRCDCGRPGRIVDSIDGRQEDYVVLPSGVRLGRLDHIFKDLTRIREAQVVQENVSGICLRVVKGEGYSRADEQRLLLETRQRLGSDIQIEIEYCLALPRTSNGKLRLVVSKVIGAEITGSGGPPSGEL